MFKRWIIGFGALLLSALAFATDVNQASEAELEAIKGIGPTLSQRIVQERQNAPFQDWPDFIERVGGVGEGRAQQFSEGGLKINGSSYQAAPSATTGKKDGAAAR